MAFLIEPLVGGRPRFCLVLRGRAVGGRTIKGRDHRSSSHRRCDVNKRQGRFGGRKNDRLIGKKPPNPVGTKEENQCRKVLVVVQSSRINLWSRLVVRGITPFAIHHCRVKVTPGGPHPTAFSQAESPYYYSPSVWIILVAPSRPVDSD